MRDLKSTALLIAVFVVGCTSGEMPAAPGSISKADEIGCSTREYPVYFDPSDGDSVWLCEPCEGEGARRFDYILDEEAELVQLCQDGRLSSKARVDQLRRAYEMMRREVDSIREIDPED